MCLLAMAYVPMDPSALAGGLCNPTLAAEAWGLPVPLLGFVGSWALIALCVHAQPGWRSWGSALQSTVCYCGGTTLG